MLIDKESQINLLMQDCKNYEDKIEYLTNQNEFLKNKLRDSVNKTKLLEKEYDKLLDENNDLRIARNKGRVL